MIISPRHFALLAILVIGWYLGLTYIPQFVGTCLDADCGFSAAEIALSIAMPLMFFVVPIAVEMVVYRKRLRTAISDIGLTRFNWTGIRLAAIYLLPLLVYFPLMSLITNNLLTTQPRWEWLFLSTLLVNGLVEETMMRGFVFRHLREGRSFWRAAGLSTIYFAGYHIPLIFSAGLMIGVIGIVIAIPIGFVTAYIYERGNNTIWGPALLHAINNGLVFVFMLSSELQPVAASLYMLLGIAVSTAMVVRAYRSRYGRSNEATMQQLVVKPS
ncbi:MAG: CPBP family intramembrane metalloprotease [Burkholderiales bacterium]|nr:CPBP family intramembrane metalloprotease [Anaerolineae bacterium]